jgi:TonB-linked SusC/RagA family outer membrane protein
MKKQETNQFNKRKISKIFLLFLCFSFSAVISAYSQTREVKGVVKDSKGEILIGVNVIEKGSLRGVISDVDGSFSINLMEGTVLEFSYIGYLTQEIIVSTQAFLNVIMMEDVKALDEVVVVSYGTQKKREITGAISNVKAGELTDLPVGQIGQKLQGQIAGVQINQSTGLPGQGLSFRIRGAASINNSSQPLIVIDGLPVSTGLNNINPDEIETFSVLKDAAATSLYGSRAANGVILITTKRGKQGKIDVSLHASYGIQTIEGMKDMDIMNAREFARFKKEFYEDSNQAVPDMYKNPEQYGAGTDWYGLLTQTAPIQNYNLSLSGGIESLKSATTIGFFSQDGVVKNTGFQRITLRSNNDYRVNDKIAIGLNMSPMYQLYTTNGTDGDRAILSGAMIADPCQAPYDENGNLKLELNSPGMFRQVNWVRANRERMDKYTVFTLLANAFVDVDIWNGIKYKLQLGADIGNRRQRTWVPSTATGGWATPPPGQANASYNTEIYYNWTAENMLTYNNSFGDHTVGALLGYSAQRYKWERGELRSSEFPSDDITWLEAAASKTGTAKMTEWSVVSMLGRFDYSFKGRYMLQLNVRRDGSSRFGMGNKYANFPSASAGWILSEEAFMKPVQNIMNYLKIRASYGITGNYNIGDYDHLATISTSNYVFNNALAPGKTTERIGNSEYTWEETSQFDIGLDFGFLNDRIFFMYDFYSKNTDGLLYQIDLPWSSGFSNIKANIGSIKSWGHELSLESRNLVGAFQWRTNLNLTFNRNEVAALSTNNAAIGGYSEYADWNRLEVGKPVGIFMGYVFDGVYMNQQEFDSQPKHATSAVGSARMKDVSGPNGVPDGVIDLNDRTIIGNPNPDMQFGLANEFKWKDFDLSILLTGQIGGDIFAGTFANTLNLDGVFNVLKSVKDRWRSEDNPGNGKIPSTQPGTTEIFRNNHSGLVYDASHLTLRNITLGYTIPLKPTNYLKKARVYFSAQQLLVLCDYPGLNPEVSDNNELKWTGLGVDRTTYPIPRTLSIGCNISF